MNSDLTELLSDKPTTHGLGGVPTEATTVASPSATVLDVDAWGQRRGRELAEEWSVADVGDVDPDVSTDAHASLFEPHPRRAETPADKQRAAWWEQMLDTPEYRSLHNQTCLDGTLSALAAKAVCDQWGEYSSHHEPAEAEGDGDGDSPEPGSDEEPVGDTLDRIRSTQQALAEARDTVETARDLAAGLGMGEPGDALDPQQIGQYFRRVRDNRTLAAIMAWAGRARSLCRSLQRRKATHGRDDLVGVEPSGDVARLVPSELAQLCCGVEELELLALERLARRQSLSRQYRGVERVGRGPIVVCVDESGSMNGQKIVAAKGLALALYWLARHQNRWVALVGFSGGTEGTRVAFPPGRTTSTEQGKLLDWLEHFYGGGTTLDVPVQELPTVYWPEFQANGLSRGKTDVILITDAIVSCPGDMLETYQTWTAAENVKTYGIVIGSHDAGDLAEVCDRHWCVPSLDLDEAAVESVLSI